MEAALATTRYCGGWEMESQPTAARATLRTVINYFFSCFKYSQKLRNWTCASLASFMQGGESEQPKSDTQRKTKTMLLRPGLWAAADPQQQQDQHPAPRDASGHTDEHQLQLWPWAASCATACCWPHSDLAGNELSIVPPAVVTEATLMHTSRRTLSIFAGVFNLQTSLFPHKFQQLKRKKNKPTVTRKVDKTTKAAVREKADLMTFILMNFLHLHVWSLTGK